MKESISNYNFEFHCITVFMLVKSLQCHNSFIYRVPMHVSSPMLFMQMHDIIHYFHTYTSMMQFHIFYITRSFSNTLPQDYTEVKAPILNLV